MPELEEPGWPNLQGGADPGAVFMNAFAIMSNVNARKRALEEKLTKMDQDARFREMKFELDKDKMERDSYFKSANLQRAYDIANINSVFKDRQLNDAQGRFEDRISRKDADLENAGKYRDEMNAWGQKYSDDLGGTEAQMQRSLIEDKYSTVLGTVEGQRQARDFSTRMNSAQAQAHKNAADSYKMFDFGVRAFGLEKGEVNMDEKYWHTDDNGNRVYAFENVPNPNAPTLFMKKYYTKKEINDIVANDKAQGTSEGLKIRYSRPIAPDTFDTLRSLSKVVQKRGTGSGSLRGVPAPTSLPSQRDIEWLKNHPEHAKAFEARFGDGSATPYLSQ